MKNINLIFVSKTIDFTLYFNEGQNNKCGGRLKKELEQY